jgi:hypothetical protein
MSPGNQIVPIPTGAARADVIVSYEQSPLTRTEYAQRIAGEWRRGVISIIKVGELLNSAQQTLSRTVYNEMVADDLPFPKSTTSMLRKVATRFAGVLYTERLPPSWMTLYLLACLPSAEFDRRLADGTINSALAQREVRGWIKERAAGSKKPPAPADESGSGETPVQEQCAQREDEIESSQQDPIPSGDQAETHSAGNCDRSKEEVNSSSSAPDEVFDPQELDTGVSAVDAADEEALRAVKVVWGRASARARKRITAFIKATVERRGKVAEMGVPIARLSK